MPTSSPANRSPANPGKSPLGIKVIGSFKLISSLLLIALGVGIFEEIGTDPAIETERIVSALKLDPGNQYIHTAMQAVSGVSRKQLYALSAGTFVYALLYAIEGAGLLLRRRWGEYFTIFMTGSLIPFEAYEVFRKPTWLRVLLLAINVGIVVYLYIQLRRSRQADAAIKPAVATIPPVVIK